MERVMRVPYKERPPVFIIFADLDGTFTPMSLSGKIDFIEVMKEIRAKENVVVKFVPSSGRPAGYVLRILHEVRDMLAEYGIMDACDYGTAEQGALVVDSSRSYGPTFLGDKKNLDLKAQVAKIMETNEYLPIISDEPDKLYTCSIHIKNEPKALMTDDQQYAVYDSMRRDVVKVYGEGVLNISMSHNCMEVMARDISKSKAMDYLMRIYSKTYNIVGILYAGDAENDKVAMVHTAKLAAIPGFPAHNFEPGNAQEAIDSMHIEPWKYKIRTVKHLFVEKGEEKLFFGITELIRRAMKERRLCGKGVTDWRVKDDHDCPQTNGQSQSAFRRVKSVNNLKLAV